MATCCPLAGPATASALYTVPKAPLDSLLMSLYFYIFPSLKLFKLNQVDQAKIRMMDAFSVSPSFFFSACVTSSSQACCLFSNEFFFTKLNMVSIFTSSNSALDPITIVCSSSIPSKLPIYGSLIKPYLRAALFPKQRLKDTPGPHEFLPGAQILIGPTHFPLQIYSCLITPPIEVIR